MLAFGLSSSLFCQTSVLTQHNDLSRTGQNLTETVLTPASVSSGNFGKIFSLTVDGVVESQPLYMPNLTVGGTAHNVVFIATEHDSVYAFDADTGGTPLWQASLLDSVHGATSGATSDPETETGCSIANGEYGISGTPVIDPATRTLYVSSATFENNYPVERLHALDITTGAEKFGGPSLIAASVPATGAGSSNGKLAFDPNLENQRAGLALVNGTVYVAFGSNCDFSNFHGWLMAYNAATLAQTAAFLTTPNGVDSGIWMGGGAPSVDTENGVNRMFITTGNGTYDATTPYAANTMDYGDDVLRLDLSNGIGISDSFTPFNQVYLAQGDSDFGAGGALLLPDQASTYPHLLIAGGKGSVIYLVNRDNMGGYNTTTNNVVQELDNQVGRLFGFPAYWNGNVYIWASADQLKQFSLTGGLLSSTPIAVSPQLQLKGIGSTPSISANGATDGIVWSVDVSQTPQVLYAHDATNVANLLWSSAANPTANSAGSPVKFPVPTIANGKVYVGANDQVLVYGLTTGSPDFSLSSVSASVSMTQGQTATDTIDITLLSGFSGAVTLSASNLPAGVTASFTASGTSQVVTFKAAASATPGNYQVTITGTSGALSHSLVVTTAVTVAGDFTVTPTPASLTLSAGTTGTAKVQITPTSIFSGNVALTCSVAPSLANVTCSVPPTVSGGSGSVMLTVIAASSARLPTWPKGPKLPPDSGSMIWGLVGMLLATCIYALTRPRKLRTLAVGFALVLVIGLSSCRGGNNSSAANSTNETGMITVVGTSGSLSHSITVSVTVQ